MSNPIDTKIVSKLAEILNKNNLSGLEYENENCRVSLSRAFGPQPVAMPVPPAPAPIVVETTPPPAIADGGGCIPLQRPKFCQLCKNRRYC